MLLPLLLPHHYSPYSCLQPKLDLVCEFQYFSERSHFCCRNLAAEKYNLMVDKCVFWKNLVENLYIFDKIWNPKFELVWKTKRLRIGKTIILYLNLPNILRLMLIRSLNCMILSIPYRI